MSKFRHEEKIPISKSDFYVLKSRLSCIFPLDSHVGANGFYTIRSLYFDDYRDSALWDKINGVNGREKFRIRTYDSGELFFLEKKSKLDGLCSKEKVKLSLLEVQSIISGNTAFLKDKSGLEREFYSKLTGNALKPRVVVSYKRIPFVYPPGNVRITLDYDIRADYRAESLTEGTSGDVPVCDNILMEIKWDEFLPDAVRQAVSIDSRRTQAFSKYAICRMYR